MTFHNVSKFGEHRYFPEASIGFGFGLPPVGGLSLLVDQPLQSPFNPKDIAAIELFNVPVLETESFPDPQAVEKAEDGSELVEFGHLFQNFLEILCASEVFSLSLDLLACCLDFYRVVGDDAVRHRQRNGCAQLRVRTFVSVCRGGVLGVDSFPTARNIQRR